MSWDLIIFDCDGVLVDSERIANRVLAEVMTEAGWPMTTAESVATFMGLSERSSRQIIDQRFGQPMPGIFEQFYVRLYDAFAAELKPILGVEGALDAIGANAWPTCVASSGSHEKMGMTLQKTGLRERFAGRVFSAHDVARGKPAPDLYLHAAAAFGARAERCAVIEDSAHGVEGGVAAGMRVFGFSDLTAGAVLEAAGARVFTRMEELAALLHEHRPR